MALPSKLGPIDRHIGGLIGSITSYGVNADAVVQQSFFEAAAPGGAASLALAATEGADTAAMTVWLAITTTMAVTEGADTLAAVMDREADPVAPPVAPTPYPDRYQGPTKPLGVIGRLAIERRLAEDGQDVVIALSGLRSETITLAGESASGKIIGYPVVRHLKSGAVVPDSVLQNGVFVIRVDDLKCDWDNIAFIKSGSSDRLVLSIEGQFDYVDAR